MREELNLRGRLFLRVATACLVVAAVGLASGCTPLRKGSPATDLRPFVPAANLQGLINPRPAADGPTWLGGDVAASIRANENTWIWLFGDTLFGNVRTDCSNGLAYCDVQVARNIEGGLINNSVGVLRRTPSGFEPIERFWRETSSGAPAPIFTSAKPGHYLWPLAGAFVDGDLLVLANENTPVSGLAPVGNILLQVENPLDQPSKWRYSRRTIPAFHAGTATEPPISWTTAILDRGEWTWLVGSVGDALSAHTVLARLETRKLKLFDRSIELEYWQNDHNGVPGWDSRFDPSRLHRLEGLPGASEASFVQTSSGTWATWQIPPLQFDILLYTATDLRGPWHEQGVVYTIPPPWNTPTRRTLLKHARLRGPRPARRPVHRGSTLACPSASPDRYMAYSPKSHPELADGNGQVLTYNVNIFFGTLLQAESAIETVPGFYVPRVIRSQFPN